MFVFECAGCGAGLTAPLSQVALPVHAHQVYGNGAPLPVLMDPGTFAVDPEPGRPPRRRKEAHALAPSDGAPGAIVIAPEDARGTLLVPEKGGGHCCGVDGSDGPNMACQACGLPVASRIDDCSLWQAVLARPGRRAPPSRGWRRRRTALLGGTDGGGGGHGGGEEHAPVRTGRQVGIAAPHTRSGRTRACSGTPWSGCRRSATPGSARSWTTSRSTCATASSDPDPAARPPSRAGAATG